jgi:heme-degrading monooxygenase HmoA
MMFARVSTYKTGPETVSDSVPDDAVQAILAIPGCQGFYYLSNKDGKDLSITLWDNEEASRPAAKPQTGSGTK